MAATTTTTKSAPKPTVPFLPTYKYEKELIATARAIAAPGKGILAADESTGTIGKRFSAIKVQNTRENRRAYREMLFTTKGLNEHISGVILYEETLYDKMSDGTTDLVQPLKDQGILLGIKVDLGTKALPSTDDETYTQGLTDLDERCKKHYKAGARFSKWRAVLRISGNTPSPLAITENAWGLAQYASICQANGLVPIVEPEILMDGEHSIAVCQYWTEKVVAACYKALSDHHVLLEGTLLKPNMVLPGEQNSERSRVTSADIAQATVRALQRTVPPAVPGITFLSGGQTEEEATVNLNALNALSLGPRPWALTFSYGRALQQTVLSVWAGNKDNVAAAQKALSARAGANGAAALGKYRGEAASEASKKSLYEANYKY